MHAVVVRAAISDPEGSRKSLHEDVIPRVTNAEGFVGGYWLAPGADGKGMSVMVFDSENAAQTAHEAIQQRIQSGEQLTPFAKMESSEVREVVANA